MKFRTTLRLFAGAAPGLAPFALRAAESFHVEEATIADIQAAILEKNYVDRAR